MKLKNNNAFKNMIKSFEKGLQKNLAKICKASQVLVLFAGKKINISKNFSTEDWKTVSG